MDELMLFLRVFEARMDAVFRCSRCGTEYILKVTSTKISWTTVIPEKAQKAQKR